MELRRTPIIDGAIAHVPLTHGRTAIIDAADAPLVGPFVWSAMTCRRKVYARRTIRIAGKQKTILLHRVILAAPDHLHVDHINGDSLDCRRSNLRLVTRQQNNLNTSAHADSRSGIKGVRKHSACSKFVAEITAHGKRHYLGLFNTIEEATAARRAASASIHGEFGGA